MSVAYAVEKAPGVDEFVGVLRRSTLMERRPFEDRERAARVLARSNVIVTARDAAPRGGAKLVGIARAKIDNAFMYPRER
jgi:hypothetical protein